MGKTDQRPVCDCMCEHCMTGLCVCFGPNTIHSAEVEEDINESPFYNPGR